MTLTAHEPSIPATPHGVQFYDEESYLYSRVSDFLANGLVAGEPAVVIATPEHRAAFANHLHAKGCDGTQPRVLYLDARQTLARFMSGSMPDRQRFLGAIGEVLENLGGADRRIRAYGEMVDLLWRDGNPQAALRLEELWNELADHYEFSLLCAYPIANFEKESDRSLFDTICSTHSHVLTTERVTDERDIARLQQRATALENEIARRKELELALRDALAARREAEEEKDFLLEATTLLSSSLDYETRLRELASLVVPRLAGACVIEVVNDGTYDRPAVAYGAIPGGALAKRLTKTTEGVLQSGTPAVIGEAMVVPMTIGPRTIGVVTFFAGEGRPSYTDKDVPLASTLARRAAIAIENARLYQLAQDANRTKDYFLATLSHELRTPLTAIVGWARMLHLGSLDEETTRIAIDTIEHSARTQASLIDDLLDVSKIVTGKLTLENELVDLSSIVQSVAQTLGLAAEAKRIVVDVTDASQRAIVMGDPTRLQQIVWNLLSNAIKFSEAGGRVTIAIEKKGGSARVVVRDFGRGISPEFLPHVFDPFEQADRANTRTHGGLGLGLAIVKYLAELHGGAVKANSDGAGKGATFSVTLPLAAQQGARVAQAMEDEAVDLRGASILVVDDDDATRALIQAVLKRCGAEVEVASSVTHACTALHGRHFDILVSDIAMPEQDGFTLLQTIRESGNGFSEIPVVALTAYAGVDAEEQLRKAGFRSYAKKPVDPLQFARTIAGILQG